MPFGLSKAGQTFQRLMDHILWSIPSAFVYLDDILITSHNLEKHATHLKKIFQVLAENGFVINCDKCVFGKTSLNFLGHTVSKNSITPPADRVDCILWIQEPDSVKTFQEFLEAINFYHRFIPHASEMLRTLHAVLHGTPRKLKWGREQSTAFRNAEKALSNATLLVHPNVKAATALTCDASGTVVGASLDQLIDGKWKPLTYFSRKLSQAELNYIAFDCELLAIYISTKHFCYFLEGQQLAIYTDHIPLTTAIASAVDSSPQQARHLSYIAKFTTDLRHLPEKPMLLLMLLAGPVLTSMLSLHLRLTSRTWLYVNTLMQTPSISRKKLTRAWCYKKSTSMESNYCVIQHVGALDLSFQHLGVRRCSTLSIVSGKMPTLTAVSCEFVWPCMNKDIINWCKLCLDCHQSKVSQYTCTPLQTLKSQTAISTSPLPPSQGFTISSPLLTDSLIGLRLFP